MVQFSSSTQIPPSLSYNETRKTVHPIINISSNSELINHVNSEGWGGNGTEGDPYVITNLTIYGNDCFASIWISNISLPLLINDCLTYGTNSINGSGIRIENSSNILIKKCFSNNNIYGISIIDCDNIVIFDNHLKRNDEGVIIIRSEFCEISENTFNTNFNNGLYLFLSNYIMIESNRIYENAIGIYLLYSEGNRILNNMIFSNSIFYIKFEESDLNQVKNNTCEESSRGMEITNNSNNNVIELNKFYGYAHDSITIKDSIRNSLFSNTIVNSSIKLYGSKATYIYQIIPENNTVNNKPILYLINRNMNWEVINNNYGQIILVEIEDLLLTKQSFNGGSIGILISFSSNISISESQFLNMNKNGIYTYNSMNIIINTSIFDNHQAGIFVQDCVNISVYDNIMQNNMCSILTMTSRHIDIINNTIMNTDVGIELIDHTNYVTLEDNIFNDIMSNSISLFHANTIIIRNNTIDSGYYGIQSSETFNVIIDGNIISNVKRCVDEGIINATIINNQFINFIDYGISTKESNYLMTNNVFKSTSGYSIILSGGNNHIINKNQIYGGGGFAGILIGHSISNHIYENYLFNCSLYFSEYETYYSNQIIIDNYIDNKPILYLNNRDYTGTKLSGDYGQVIISSCSNLIIDNSNIISYGYGVIIAYSQNITITNCDIISKGTGLHIIYSNNCIIKGNKFNGTNNAISLKYVKSNVCITNCLFYNIKNGVFSQILGRGFSVTNNAFIESPCFSDNIYLHYQINETIFRGNYWNDHVSDHDLITGIMDNPYCIKDSYYDYEIIYDLYPIAYLPKEIIAPPINVVAQTPENKIILSWEGFGANEYVIFRSHWGEPFTEVARIEGSNYNSHVFFSDNTNINYTYRVQGIWDLGPTFLSDSETVIRFNPVLEIISPSDGEFINRTDIEIKWTYNFAPTSKIFIRFDEGEEIFIGTSSSYNITDLSEGEHIVTITIMTEQNKSVSETIKFFVDSTNPWIDINRPKWEEYYNTSDVIIKYDYSDGANILLNHSYSLDNNVWHNISNIGKIELFDLEDGEYLLAVKIIDKAGNIVTDHVRFYIDTISPYIVDYGPKDGILCKNEYMYYTISELTLNSYNSSIKINGELPSNISRINKTFYIPYEEFLLRRSHTVQIYLQDIAGNDMETFIFSFLVEGVMFPYQIIGRIIDGDEKPIQGVSIYIYENDELIELAISQSDGTFSISLYNNNYSLETYSIDHSSVKMNFAIEDSNLDLGDIVINEYEENLILSPPITPAGFLLILFLVSICMLLIFLITRRSYLYYREEDEE